MKKLSVLLALAILLGAFSIDPAPAQACGGWWDPCCPWWMPDQCPPAVKQVKKALAEKNGDYFDNARNGFLTASAAICPWFPETLVACLTSGTFAGVSLILSQDQKKIARDPWDPYYEYPYDPIWHSAEELGLPGYTGNGYLDNAVWYTQAINMMADMIYVSGNRASSCDQVGAGCGYWQRERVDWALWMLGAYINGLGNETWNIAYQVQQEGGADDLVALLREVAWVSNDSGWRYQQ